MADGREGAVELVERTRRAHVHETFDAETEDPPDARRAGWLVILDDFSQYAEAKPL